MRLATIRVDGTTRAARIEGGRVRMLDFPDVGKALRSGEDLANEAGTPIGTRPEELDYAPLVLRPGKVICVGHNYRAHITEMGHEPPDFPTLFAKFAQALIGARDPITMPEGSVSVDWEAELAVVIGRTVRSVGAEQAAGAIAGFTVANDISARDYQRRTSQWLQGKTFEATTPLGPVLVSPEEVGTSPDLAITCEVDGLLRQSARTGDLVFSPPDLVSYVSRILTLEPGDVLLTGTPGGVGAAMQPPAYLEKGQTVTTVIEGIGTCVNTCVSDPGTR